MTFKNKFSNLGQPNKIWVISAIHGDCTRLVGLHQKIYDKFQPGDRLVYTGNYLAGRGAGAVETLDEIIYFRRTLLARPGVVPEDLVYLRGIQEELWHKILHLQFAANPREVLEWMAKRHPEMDAVLRAYGSSLEEGIRTAREGILNLTRWTIALKAAVRAHAGHDKFFSALRRAAFTERRTDENDNLLFVHAGLDPELPLVAQGDNFWWASRQFSQMQESYRPFKSVIRGFDPERQGLKIGPVTISLGGDRLLCAEMSGQGDVLEILAA